MGKNYKNVSLLLGLSLSFFYGIAQQKENKKENSFTQPPSIIIFDDVQDISKRNSANIFEEYLKLDKNNSFVSLSTSKDNLNITHQKFQQQYKGIKVEFGTAIIDSKKGKVTSLHGEYYNVKDINISPKLSKKQAFEYAIQHTGAEKYLWENPDAAKAMDNYQPGGELVILANLDAKNAKGVVNEFNLVYKFDIYATKPLSRGYLYIDATTGEAKLFNSIIKHASSSEDTTKPLVTIANKSSVLENVNASETYMFATGTAATRYSGTQNIETNLSNGRYTLNDTRRKIYTRNAKNQVPGSSFPYITNYDEFTDNDNNWTAAEHTENKDNAALDAHWGAAKTYDYFASIHNRRSYDNRGAQIRSYVHVGTDYNNAFWNGSVMSYGDGSSNGNEGNGRFDALTSVDVAAHEIAHAVTTYTADLAYRRESGALNEGFSDIWGAAIEHYAKGNGSYTAPAPEVWLIGDEIDRRTNSPASRSMSDPSSLGKPDTYGGQYWMNPNCGTPSQSNDNCGVHINSGVLNYWFYLTVMGGSGTNDVGNNYNVSGIGMRKSEKIAYRTLSVYLSANSTFADARLAAIQATKDLYGAGGVEEKAVTNAWYAVNVGSAYGNDNGDNSSYCTSKGNSVADEYISRVKIGAINNTSGADGGYADNTSISTSLAKRTSHSITITPSWTGTKYDEGYAVWIDYNQNNSFEDAGELVWSKAPSKTSPVNGTFNIPSSAKDGATRIRVAMKYEGTPTSSCEIFSYGEVEDYTIVIGTSSPADTEAPSIPTRLASADIEETTFTLSWNASTDNIAVVGYEVYQGNTKLGTIDRTVANITGLTKGTEYQFRVKAFDAADNVSDFSSVLNITTISESSGGNDTSCTSLVSSFPYNEGYENTFGDWSQSSDDDTNWTIDRSGTPSSGTGPSSANEGSYYIFVEASGEGTGFPNKQAIINSPCYDLSNITEASFSFDYHMYGDSDMGSISLEASTNNGNSWTRLWRETGNKGNSWKNATIDLTRYTGNSIQLRFNRITGGSWKADIAIDNLSLNKSSNDNDGDNNDDNGDTTTNICDGVSPYDSTRSYRRGDRVIYQGDLYERGFRNWSNLGPCVNTFTLTNNANDSIGPNSNILSVYPNPTNKSEVLNIKIHDTTTKQYQIIDMLGKIVSEGTFDKTINIQQLDTGMYILKVNTEATRFVIN